MNGLLSVAGIFFCTWKMTGVSLVGTRLFPERISNVPSSSTDPGANLTSKKSGKSSRVKQVDWVKI
jgi:hypothetical protein